MDRQEPARPERPPRASMWREAGTLVRMLRLSPRRGAALGLAALIVAVILANLVGQVRLNAWHGDFFDAIEKKDLAGVGRQVIVFFAVIAVLLTLVVAQTWLHEMLKLRLREMLTHRILDAWLAPGRAWRLAQGSEAGANPDRRIEEDVRHLADLSADLAIGFVHQLMLLSTFIGVLWGLSANITLPVGGGERIAIPGYMVWCALLYAMAGSWLAWRVGRPLIRLNEERYAREAAFRFAVMRTSEMAERVTVLGGGRPERRVLGRSAADMIEAMRRIAYAVARLTWVTSGYGWIAILVPVLVALPGYFSGALTLGGLMMAIGAFNQVQGALRWFVDNYARLADWQATLHRVGVLTEALAAADPAPGEACIRVAEHPRGRLSFEEVVLRVGSRRFALRPGGAEFGPGSRVAVAGDSSAGKAALFQAMAGLRPQGSGAILLPPRSELMLVPRDPYLPLGDLRAAFCYPALPEAFADAALAAALLRLRLERWLPMLDRDERWDRRLSPADLQRVAFVRLLLHKPRWIVLDEAALEDTVEADLRSLLERELAGAAVLGIGTRPALDGIEVQRLDLVTLPETAAEAPPVPAAVA